MIYNPLHNSNLISDDNVYIYMYLSNKSYEVNISILLICFLGSEKITLTNVYKVFNDITQYILNVGW